MKTFWKRKMVSLIRFTIRTIYTRWTTCEKTLRKFLTDWKIMYSLNCFQTKENRWFRSESGILRLKYYWAHFYTWTQAATQGLNTWIHLPWSIYYLVERFFSFRLLRGVLSSVTTWLCSRYSMFESCLVLWVFVPLSLQ